MCYSKAITFFGEHMKFFKLLSIALLALVASQAAVARDGGAGQGYFKIGAGYGTTDHKDSVSTATMTKERGRGLMYDAGVGYYVNDYYKTELELLANSGLTSKTSSAGGKVKATTYGLYANGIAELNGAATVSPYFLIGVGAAYVKPKSSIAYKTGYGFSYQAGIGAAVAITNQMSLDLGVRYIGYQKTKYKAKDDSTYPNGNYKKAADMGVLANLVVKF
jgi:opacity protein-like surface antigen